MNGFRRIILSRFQSDVSSLIIGACRANGCLPPSHYVSRVYSTRLECSQSTGTPGTNRGPFFFMFLNTCATIFRGSAHIVVGSQTMEKKIYGFVVTAFGALCNQDPTRTIRSPVHSSRLADR